MSDTKLQPTVHIQGPDAVLVRFSDRLSDTANRAALRFADRVERAALDGIVEIASALVSVLVRFDPVSSGHTELSASLQALLESEDWSDSALPSPRTLWHVPVAFGGDYGPQLASVAEAAGVRETQAVEDITSTELRVLALGFAPGQPYLGFLPDAYDLPRQTDLTAEVPASSIVLAVRQIVLFANPAPTGWRQVGQSLLPCCRPEWEKPVLLSAGDGVRFHAVGHGELEALRSDPMGGVKGEVMS